MLGFIEWFILFCIAVAIVVIGGKWLMGYAELPQPLRLMLVLFAVAIIIVLLFNFFPVLPHGRLF